jgi:hypothetical protein
LWARDPFSPWQSVRRWCCRCCCSGSPAIARAGAGLDLPPLVLWAWDRNDELSFLDTRDTAVAFLAATRTLRGAGVVLTPRHRHVQGRV